MGFTLLATVVIMWLYVPWFYKETTGERILITSMGFSHIYGLAAIGNELQSKGHEVMFLTPKRAEEHILKAVGGKDRSRIVFFGNSNAFPSNGLANHNRYSDLFAHELKVLAQVVDDWCGVVMDLSTMALIKKYNPDFVLVDTNIILLAPLMLPYALNVTYGVRTTTLHNSLVAGILPSWYPQAFDEGYTDEMNFLQRLRNTAVTSLLRTVVSAYYSYIWSGCLGVLFPGIYHEFRKDAAINLVNTDLSIEYPIPLPPKVVFIGGAHIKKPKPLPNDLEQYFVESKGVIYLSIGSEYKSYPKNLLTAIIFLMNHLKESRLLMTLNDAAAIDHPRIKTLPYAPQNDILSHSKVRLFISHCGTNSQMEAVYNAKPILCIPITRDQFHNAARIKKRGMGLALPDIWRLTGQELMEAVTEMLNQTSYLEAAQRLSLVFHKQPQTPAERGAHWIDLVVKHGSEHLQFSGNDLWWWQYYLLDVWFTILTIMFVSVYVSYYFISYVYVVCAKGRKDEKLD